MSDNSPPSRNYANDDSLLGLIRLALAKFLQNDIDDMLPAQVLAYDRATNRAQVQPLIVQVNTNDVQIKRAQIASVPVLQLGGGGFVLSFPIITGDLGWIKANDRDISLFKRTYKQSPPNTQRNHRFSDALFIPDNMLRGVTLSDDDANNVVLQNLAGTSKISIGQDSITLTSTRINLVMSDSVNVTAPNINATGDLAVTGNFTVTGTSTLNGVPFETHRHTLVQTGADDSGGPIP